MEREQLTEAITYRTAAGLGAIALFASALTAVLMLIVLRQRSAHPAGEKASGQTPARPVVDTVAMARMSNHFSEDLLVPGLTHTGPEIAEQAVRQGRSPEGV